MDARLALMVAAGIGLFGALIHFVAPWYGPEWYAYWHAPREVVESARNGTWLAPLSTMAVGAAMLAAGLYALSAAGAIRRLPLLKPALVVLSVLCVLRASIVIPFLILAPQRLGAFDLAAAAVWLTAGLGFLYGLVRAAAIARSLGG
jgi:hypothetical protein